MIVHDGKHEPHWAPGAATYLDSLLTGEEVAIEWGGGGSSAWLVSRVKHLHTIESSPDWIDRIVAWSNDAENLTIHRHSRYSPDYVHCVDEINSGVEVSLWLIDGYNRIGCLAKMLEKMQTGDIVVLDDALDYAEHLLGPTRNISCYKMPHPYAGTPIKTPPYRNTVRTHHALTKETWVWVV